MKREVDYLHEYLTNLLDGIEYYQRLIAVLFSKDVNGEIKRNNAYEELLLLERELLDCSKGKEP